MDYALIATNHKADGSRSLVATFGNFNEADDYRDKLEADPKHLVDGITYQIMEI